MNELPNGWVNLKLGDLIELKYGKSLPAKQRSGIGFPVYGSNGVVGLHTEALVSGGGLIVGRKGSFGEVHLCEDDFSPIDTTYYVDSFPSGTMKYWYYQLKNLPLTKLNRSTAIPGLNRDDAYAQDVLLPPDAEQKRIVEKLDEVLAQVGAIKARLDGIPALLKRFRQSVLASAVSGKLTEEWRIGKSLKQRVTLNLNEVTSHVVDCPHSTPKWSDEGRYCVRTTAFNPFYLDLSGQGYVNDEVFALRTSRLTPEAGDILYSREGTVGIACQIPEGVELCLGQRMVVIRANERVDAKYLTIVLNSDHILRIVRELTIGSTAPRVNMKVIRDYPIPVPDCIEQQEIVRLVDQYFAFADTIEAQVKKAQARVDNLTQSILAKAFRGELVEQDPSDEPADKLLERIAEARKEAEALAKAAKKAEAAKKRAAKSV
ncbi:restriction endonuclease subunit S [Vibrio minamisatsumaniensis]|uniref:restriction endonuclease subunit S n=1 Tax=Vibrio minamisatsumaniensis TaxID=2910243 RepID=UPI003D24366F